MSLDKVATWLAEHDYAVYPTSPGTNVPTANCGTCRDGCDMDTCACRTAVDPCHGLHAASTDPELTAARWEEEPDRNPALHLGQSGLVVIDVDDHGHAPPAELAPGMPMPEGVESGMDAFRALLAELGQPWPDDTLDVASPNGGRHLYFRSPVADLRPCDAAWQVEVKTGNVGIVAPGGLRKLKDGGMGQYRRISDAVEPAPFPRWLGEHLVERGIVPDPTQPVQVPEQRQRRHGPGSHREAWWTRAREGLLSDIAGAPEGRRNEVATRAGFRLMALTREPGCPWTAEQAERDLVEAQQMYAARQNRRGREAEYAALARGCRQHVERSLPAASRSRQVEPERSRGVELGL